MCRKYRMWKFGILLGLFCGFVIVTAGTGSTTGIESTTGIGSTTGTGRGSTTETGTGTGTGETTTDYSTTGNQPDDCEGKGDCSDCVTSTNCVWCQDESSCRTGVWYGPLQTCSDWRWKQCDVNGKYALLGVVCAIALGLLCLLACVCFCCCCTRKKSEKRISDFKKFKALQLEEQESLVSKHPKTDERRAELVKKYSSKLNPTSDV